MTTPNKHNRSVIKWRVYFWIYFLLTSFGQSLSVVWFSFFSPSLTANNNVLFSLETRNGMERNDCHFKQKQFLRTTIQTIVHVHIIPFIANIRNLFQFIIEQWILIEFWHIFNLLSCRNSLGCSLGLLVVISEPLLFQNTMWKWFVRIWFCKI